VKAAETVATPWLLGFQVHVPVVELMFTFLHLGIGFPFSKKVTLPGVETVAVRVLLIRYLGEELDNESDGVDEYPNPFASFL
jgi:hypothetical protein